MESATYNPLAREVLEDPFPAYAAMRTACPVHRFDAHDPPLLHRIPVCRRCRDRDGPRALDDALWHIASIPARCGFQQRRPEHVKFRRAVLAGLTPNSIGALEPEITALVGELVTGMRHNGPGDFHDLFAAPLPLAVIAKLLGVSGEHQRFKELSDSLMAEGMNSTDVAEFHRIAGELDHYWDEQLAPRRAALASVPNPGPQHLGTVVPDDLMSMLLVFRAQDGRPLTQFEISNSLMNLLLAGNETTTSLLTNVVWRLLENPHLWESLVSDRTLIDSAIEESLRFDAPVLGMFRTSLTDVELGGTPIPPKCKIHVNYAAANRDPEIFSDPDEFHLDRPQDELRRHLAFGRGAHVCPGAQLSRLEARIALDALLDNFPTLRLDGPTTRIAPFNFWGRRTLPVAW